MTTELARRATVTELVHVYQQACDEIRAAFLVVDAATKRMDNAFGLERSFHIRDNCHHYVSFNNPDRTIEALRRDTWKALVNKLEIRAMLSIKRTNELDALLERGDLPEITERSVHAFAAEFVNSLDTILREAVEEVFEFLRPHSSEFKTNTEFEIGRKCILEYMVESDWLKCYHVNHRRQAQLTALENVFTALDGKGQIHKGWKSNLQAAIEQVELASNGKGETEYFAFRCFKKRTLHLTFKRPDLVARLNQIAGGKRLRAEAAA